MRKPSFFLIGAPKCGTTSLYNWLSAHPNIFMPQKEIHWFNQDHGGGCVNSLQEYEKLFGKATRQHIAVGDASVWYLYSHAAVKNIILYNTDAKFIVLIRNPVDMAVSLHGQLYYTAQENIRDFESAWRMQDERVKFANIPSVCEDPAFLQYGKACLLGAQIARLYSTADKERVLVLLLDDFKKDPRTEYLKVLQFISVPDDGRIDFRIYNEAKIMRSFIFSLYIAKIAQLKQFLRIKSGIGVLRILEGINRRKLIRNPLEPELRKELNGYFKSDISKLGSLINRDLSCWLRNKL